MSKEIMAEWLEKYGEDLGRFLWRWGVWFIICGLLGIIRITYEIVKRKKRSIAEMFALFILIFCLSMIVSIFIVWKGWYISGLILIFLIGIFGEKFLDYLSENTTNIFTGILDKVSDALKKK